MRVHDPGPGEIFDRIGILGLKIGACEDAAACVEFMSERRTLRELAAQRFPGTENSPLATVLYDELFQINNWIWKLTDNLHDYNLDDKSYARQARLTFKLNEARAVVIGEINRAFGVDRREKI